MRKTIVAPFAARKPSLETSLPPGRRDDSPVELVCIALALAILTLVARIVSIW
jgi:hypothetical protein